jgi:two-component system sporulation sensor kinase A
LKKGGKEGENKTEIRIRHRDGRFFWFEVIGAAIRNEKGKIAGAVLGGRDVTHRKEIEDHLRQSEETFQALTESTGVAIFVVQGEKFRYINKAFTILSGYYDGSSADTSFLDLIAPGDEGFCRERDWRASGGKKFCRTMKSNI